MEEDDEDNMYAPAEIPEPGQGLYANNGTGNASIKREGRNREEDGEEEGEEVEEEESDSDIDIITERKGSEAKPEPLQPRRVASLKEPQPGTPSADPVPVAQRSPATKTEPLGRETPTRLGSSYPAVKISNVDVDTKPIYEPNGLPITDIDMDSEFPEDDKPWRRPGTDMTDYFNYGFDEFTWASYCLKQGSLRKEVMDSKKQMEEMQNFLSMPSAAIPGLPGAPGGAQPAMPPMGGPADIPPEMQQMMAQMMAQGMDPTQMDPGSFMQMMQGGQGGGGGGDPNQNFGGQGFGTQGQNQQMGYGYGGSGGGGGGGGGGGRNQGGRGNRRW